MAGVRSRLRLHRPPRPLFQLRPVFDYLRRHLVIALQALPDAGTKRFHPSLKIIRARQLAGGEEKLSLENNSKNIFAGIKSVAAKHGPASGPEILKLSQNEVAE